MSKIYTLRKQVGDDGVSVSVASSTSKERIQLKLSGILDENRRYLDEVNNLESKVGKYYREELVPYLYSGQGTLLNRETFSKLENKYIKSEFSSLFNYIGGTGSPTKPDDYGLYYAKYKSSSGKLDIHIPDEDLIRIVENRPKKEDIKEPDHYCSEHDFSIEESELI